MIDIPIADVKDYLRVSPSVAIHDDVIERCYQAAKAEAEKQFSLAEDEEPSADVVMFVLKRAYRHFEHRIDGVTSETIAGVGSVNLSEDTKIKRGRVKFV